MVNASVIVRLRADLEAEAARLGFVSQSRPAGKSIADSVRGISRAVDKVGQRAVAANGESVAQVS